MTGFASNSLQEGPSPCSAAVKKLQIVQEQAAHRWVLYTTLAQGQLVIFVHLRRQSVTLYQGYAAESRGFDFC